MTTEKEHHEARCNEVRRMRRFGVVFLWWFVALLLACFYANLPSAATMGGKFFQYAGFPFTFAVWQFDVEQSFDESMLMLDAAICVGCSVLVASLCAFSRCRASPRRK